MSKYTNYLMRLIEGGPGSGPQGESGESDKSEKSTLKFSSSKPGQFMSYTEKELSHLGKNVQVYGASSFLRGGTAEIKGIDGHIVKFHNGMVSADKKSKSGYAVEIDKKLYPGQDPADLVDITHSILTK